MVDEDRSNRNWGGSRAEWAFGYGVVGTLLAIGLLVAGELGIGLFFALAAGLAFAVSYYQYREDRTQL